MRYKAHTDPFYKTAKWKHLREAALRRDAYIDRLDLRDGERNAAEVVHHIFPREQYPQYRYCLWNLISLTNENHELMHNRMTGELSSAGRALMTETAAEHGIKTDTLILVIGLPGSGKTEYVRQHMGNGVAYDLDHIAAAFRLRQPHGEIHETARRMANSLAHAFADNARRYGGTIHVIRSAPTVEEMISYDPDEIVYCRGQYDILGRRDYRRADTREQEHNIGETVAYAKANGIKVTEA